MSTSRGKEPSRTPLAASANYAPAPVHLVVLGVPHAILQEIDSICCPMQWLVHPSSTLEEALSIAHGRCARAILAYLHPESRSWREILANARNAQSTAPLIFLSPLADHHLWLEVLDAGGHDLLLTPLNESEFVHTVQAACKSASVALKGAAVLERRVL